MHKIWLIIQARVHHPREDQGIRDRHADRAAGIGVGFTLLHRLSGQPPIDASLRIAIVDNAGGIASVRRRGPADAAATTDKPQFNDYSNRSNGPLRRYRVQDDLRAKINSSALDAYLVIPSDLSQSVELHTKNPGNFSLIGAAYLRGERSCGRSAAERPRHPRGQRAAS